MSTEYSKCGCNLIHGATPETECQICKLEQQLAKQAEQLKEAEDIIKLIENLFCFFIYSDKDKKAMVEIRNAIQKYKGKE